MAEKSIPRKMYEKVMGTPEQNEEAQKRMDERDKKNPDSMPAKINKAVKTVTGKKDKDTGKGQGLPRGKATFESGPTTSEDGDVDNITVTRNPNDKSQSRLYSPPIGGKRGSPFKNLDEASKYASELQRETRGMKKGGKVSSASSRADGIAQKGKTKGRMY
jgi:hypothetical protein